MARIMMTLDNGLVGTRADYIRQEFAKNKTRGEIAEEMGIDYAAVYAATANLTNDAKATRAVKVIMVDDPEQPGELIERDALIIKMVKAGIPKKEVAKQMNLHIGTIYKVTKGVAGVKGASGAKLVLPDGTQVFRKEFLAEEFAKGLLTRRELANMYGLEYTQVFNATKGIKGRGTKQDAKEVEVEAEETEE